MSTPGRSIVKGRALYDFVGKSEMRQLSFKAGEVINITNQYDNGWWAGELNGTVGYLPATYVQLIGSATVPLPASEASSPSPVSNGRPTSSYGAPGAPSSAGRPTLSSATSAGSPTPPSGRPQSGYGAAAAPVVPSAAARPPLGGGAQAPTAPPVAARPPLSTPAASQPPVVPPAATRPSLSTPSTPAPAPAPAPAAATPTPATPAPSYPTRPVSVNNKRGTTVTMRTLSSAERGRAATLRPGASEVSDVSEADIVELDQLISKLQSDVSELKKLM